MIRAFTGPSKIGTIEQSQWICQRMMAYPDAEVWRSGCAYHVDTLAARVAMNLERHLILYVPAAPHNDQLVASLAGQRRVLVVRCGRGKQDTDVSAYRRRNEIMISGEAPGSWPVSNSEGHGPADQLVAFVTSPNFYRSGEWMTINIAKKLGVPVSIEVIPKEVK